MNAGDGALIAITAMVLAAYLVLKLCPIPVCGCQSGDFQLWESELDPTSAPDDLLDLWDSAQAEVPHE